MEVDDCCKEKNKHSLLQTNSMRKHFRPGKAHVGKGKLYLKMFVSLMVMIFFISNSLMAQTVKVSGIVTDDNKKPLEGVTVQEKSTKKTTVTDAQGKFTLETIPNGTLVFTNVGFSAQEIPVSEKTIKVNLKEE